MTLRRFFVFSWVFVGGWLAGQVVLVSGGCSACGPEPDPPTPGTYRVVDAFREELLDAMVEVVEDPELVPFGRQLRIHYTLGDKAQEMVYDWPSL
jgi:hypothetical protein